jgi:hypothetical protein
VHPPPLRAAPRVLSEALADLQADYDELLFLCRGAEARLAEVVAKLDAASLHRDTRESLSRRLSTSRRSYRSATVRLLALRERAHQESPSPSLVRELTAGKVALADLLRVEQALTATFVTAADWQSPPFLSSTMPASGRRNGRIEPHWNDYKRVRHLDADEFERRYLDAMVDGPPGLGAMLTSSASTPSLIVAMVGAVRSSAFNRTFGALRHAPVLIGDIGVDRVRLCPSMNRSTSPSPVVPTIPALRATFPMG